MSRKTQILTLLATLCTGVAFAQHVYVQTAAGVSVFKTDMAKVGSYTPDGTLVGVGSFLVTTRTGWLNTYAIKSSGAIGERVSDINMQLYSNSECGLPNGFVIHGAFVYATVSTEVNGCYTIQTYEIGTTGLLTFKGVSTPILAGSPLGVSGLTALGNGKFAYAWFYNGYDESSCTGPSLVLFAAESSGTLNGAGGTVDTETWPTLPPGNTNWALTGVMATDATDHGALVAKALDNNGGNCGDGFGFTTFGPPQLISFTVNSHGIISSTNTYKNMPGVGNASLLTINPAGTFLAAAVGTGTQVFKFHGASPITTLDSSPVIGTSGYIVSYAWNGDTLYAVNGASGKVHVYDVSTSKVVEAKGSPYAIGALTVFVK